MHIVYYDGYFTVTKNTLQRKRKEKSKTANVSKCVVCHFWIDGFVFLTNSMAFLSRPFFRLRKVTFWKQKRFVRLGAW